VLDHRPHREARRDQRFFHDRDLPEQLGRHPCAGLVSGPQVVAEALDDVVGRHTHVRSAIGHDLQRRSDDASRSVERARVGVPGHLAEVLAEQFVGPVDEMHAHGTNVVGRDPAKVVSRSRQHAPIQTK
jgi:hypothetical protein